MMKKTNKLNKNKYMSSLIRFDITGNFTINLGTEKIFLIFHSVRTGSCEQNSIRYYRTQ